MKYAYVDSSVWITRFEGNPTHTFIVRDSMNQLELEGWHFCYSELVMLEVLLKPKRLQQDFLIEAYS